jgi:secreted trypsin-like serine protease
MRAALLLCLLLSVVSSEAIIVRHDVSSADYEVRASDYPAIFFLERQGSRKVCVATVIHPRWAITAAHCAAETMLGETTAAGRRFAVTVANRQREIDLVIAHPEADLNNSADVDLALLRFAAADSLPRPMPLYNAADEQGQVADILGWGYFGLGTTGRQYDDGRLRLAQNRIDVSAARLRMVFDDPRLANSGSLALEGSLGLGDSGGPALLTTLAGPALAGIAVGEVRAPDYSEETQGHYGSVTVYERISRHLDWIEAVLGGPPPYDS